MTTQVWDAVNAIADSVEKRKYTPLEMTGQGIIGFEDWFALLRILDFLLAKSDGSDIAVEQLNDAIGRATGFGII